MSAIIHNIHSQNRNTDGKHKQLIGQIARCLNEELSELIGRMFDGADDMLFQLAENADSNEDQNQYFDTMRMLRIERKNIGQNFAANLKTYLQPASTKAGDDTVLEDELSLVDQDEMEELVAVSAMHSKAMSLYGEAVNHLEARIEFLSLKSALPFHKDALAPKNICDSFKTALSDIELSTNNKLVLYKLFDQEVIVNLATLYKNLNQIFIDQGILPQIKLGNTDATSPKQPTAPAPTPEANTTDAVYTENPVYNPTQQATYNSQHQTGTTNTNSTYENTSNQVHRVVSQFITGELTASGPGIPSSFTTSNNTPGSSGTQYYDRRDVMKSLSNLQHNVAQSSESMEQINAADFKRALLTDMGSRSGGAVTKQVNNIDEKTIDFIEMLFNAIVEDNSISTPVTNLLLRLQIPVIKVAMLDEDFFVNGDHPCRSTLNLIAHLGRGLSSRNEDIFSRLNSVVDNLLNDFNIDIASFEIAVTDLEIIEQDELTKTIQKERETQKTVLQSHAREVVLAELQHHVINKQLPGSARKLLLKHWSTLMFHCYIKFGKNSDDWTNTVTTAKQLIRLLQPIESSQAYHQLNSEKDELLDTIHKALLDTRQNPVEIETEINNVFISFEKALENNQFNSAAQTETQTYFVSVDDELDDSSTESNQINLDEIDEPTLDIEEETINPLEEQSNIAREKIALLPSDVRPGVWFKVFNGEDKNARRAKLSVIIMEEAKLIFVDRHGVKVLEKDAAKFTEELATDSSQIIADHSAFDHALGLVINSLSSAK